MSTNFYMFTKKRDLKPYFGAKLKLVNEPEIGYQIHIAKIAYGWKPIFEAHEHIRSVADLKHLYDKGGIRIFDENNKEYTWAAFAEKVVNWGNDKRNWRSLRNCDFSVSPDLYEYISVDGYRFTDDEFV